MHDMYTIICFDMLQHTHRFAHVKVLREVVNRSKKSLTPFNLVQVPFYGNECTDQYKIAWLLSLRDRDSRVPNTGKLLFGCGSHVYGWDAWNGVVYDPDPTITTTLPATARTVKALCMHDIHTLVEIVYKNKTNNPNWVTG